MAARRDLGFSLVELVVALAIVALALGLVLANLTPGRHAAGLRAAATEIRAALRAAHSAAITGNREIRFAIDPSGRSYILAGQRYAFRLAGFGTGELAAEGDGIVFYPTGGSSGGRIVLRSGSASRILEIDPATGRADDVP